MQFRFVADEPIEKRDLDALGFGAFVDRVHAALAETKTPFVYGLLGPWGSGKTSIQKLLAAKFREEFEANQTESWIYVPIWVDAWRYENQDNMIFPLLNAFRESRAEFLGAVEQDGNFLSGLRTVAAASAIAFVDLGLRAVTKKAFGDAMKLKDIKEHVDDVINQPDEVEKLLTTWIEQVDGLQTKYEKFIQDYAGELAAKRHTDTERIRFVVFIDDLDRCMPSVAVGLLENIKNHLSVPGCIYILGINPSVIAQGISAKYAGLQIGGREYLEKILNYSFAVPVPAADALKNFGMARLADLLTDQQDRDKHQAALSEFGETLAKNGFNNPRKIKRILNSYLLFIATQAGLERFNMTHVTQLIVLAEYYPELFRLAERGSLDAARRVFQGPGKPDYLAPEKFQSTYGFALDGSLADLATMPDLLLFPPSSLQGRAKLAEHIEAVLAVCGRI